MDPGVRARHRSIQAEEETHRGPLPEGPEADVRGAVCLKTLIQASKP